MHVVQRLFTAMLLTVASGSHAFETVASPQDARAMTDQVMAKVAANELDDVAQTLKSYTNAPDAEAEVAASIGQLKLQRSLIAQRFGSSLGAEFVRQEKIGDSLLRITHLHRFERHAMRWSFHFYRTNKGWVLSTFSYDDNPAALFQ